MFSFLTRRRREKLRCEPVPEAWRKIVRRNVPMAGYLSHTQHDELFGHLHVLLAEKRFEGCGGLAMTDEIRVTIAAQAAFLLLDRETRYFPKMRSVLVYPEAFTANVEEEQDDGTVIAGPDDREGESWIEGSVALSWADALDGCREPHDGYNLVLHEFAHQLDAETGGENGLPRLPSREAERAWRGVFSREFESHVRAVEAGRPTLLDEYGAESPAEFFAVCVECFFELGMEMKADHPELYEQLARYFHVDTAPWE